MSRSRNGLKTRPDPRARLDYLSYDQHERLCEWLLTQGVTYSDVKRKIKSTFGFTISTGAIAQFYKNNVGKYLGALRERAVNVAAGYIAASQGSPTEFTLATVDALEAKTMQAALNPQTDPKELKIYLDLICRWQELRLRSQEIAIQLRRLKMLERKQKRLEAIFTVESKLSSDEVAKRCRIIFQQNGELESTSETKAEKLLPGFSA